VRLVPDYRICVIKSDDHIDEPPNIITCNDDREAVQQACQFAEAQNVEVWEGPRLVTRLKSAAR
jgi:hypothetical protein